MAELELESAGMDAFVGLGDRNLYAQRMHTLPNRKRVTLLSIDNVAKPEWWTEGWPEDWGDDQVVLLPFDGQRL